MPVNEHSGEYINRASVTTFVTPYRCVGRDLHDEMKVAWALIMNVETCSNLQV